MGFAHGFVEWCSVPLDPESTLVHIQKRVPSWNLGVGGELCDRTQDSGGGVDN